MNGLYISEFAGKTVMELTPENTIQFEMLEEFAERCESEGRPALTVRRKREKKYIVSGGYCGFVRLSDGTLTEVLPRVNQGGALQAKKNLCAELCRRCTFEFNENSLEPDMSFMEFLVSVFSRESMKIIKSGLLSAYASKEENMTSVQGTILFAENIRKNLVHRERLYVRHDVFTPDRAENRLMKAAAQKLIKITDNPHSSQLLKQIISFLDDVRLPANLSAEFSKCVNTRNTKKYSTVLGICRMLFDSREGTAFSGKYVSCALFFEDFRNNDSTE